MMVRSNRVRSGSSTSGPSRFQFLHRRNPCTNRNRLHSGVSRGLNVRRSISDQRYPRLRVNEAFPPRLRNRKFCPDPRVWEPSLRTRRSESTDRFLHATICATRSVSDCRSPAREPHRAVSFLPARRADPDRACRANPARRSEYKLLRGFNHLREHALRFSRGHSARGQHHREDDVIQHAVNRYPLRRSGEARYLKDRRFQCYAMVRSPLRESACRRYRIVQVKRSTFHSKRLSPRRK